VVFHRGLIPAEHLLEAAFPRAESFSCAGVLIEGGMHRYATQAHRGPSNGAVSEVCAVHRAPAAPATHHGCGSASDEQHDLAFAGRSRLLEHGL